MGLALNRVNLKIQEAVKKVMHVYCGSKNSNLECTESGRKVRKCPKEEQWQFLVCLFVWGEEKEEETSSEKVN